MSRTIDPDLRQNILAACFAAVLKAGRLDLSINKLGELAGTSGRMLVYHFESKDKLDALLIQTVEQNFRNEYSAFAARFADSPDFLVAFWDHMTQDKKRLALLRLAYEVTCTIAHQKTFQPLVRTEVGGWLSTLVDRFESEDKALIVLVIFQGAVVDLCMSGDPTRGRRALEAFTKLLLSSETSSGKPLTENDSTSEAQ